MASGGGRRFGRLVTTFTNFGQATSAEHATWMVSGVMKNGAPGIVFAIGGHLLIMPVYWFTNRWWRRIRLLTLADFFVERYGSRRMAACFALISVSNCILRSHCTALKFGTESTGGFRNITVTNCTIQTPDGDAPFFGYPEGRCGIALETVDGGRLENVTISNIVIDGVAIPFFMRLGNRARPHTAGAPKPGVGSFRNIVLSNLIATGAGRVGCAIAGIPGHPVENVTLRDLRLEFSGGGTAEDAGREIPEREAAYPEGDMFGTLPAFGVYARHARNLQLHNVQLVTNIPDERPATAFDDVQ